jgi:hypothetical protein
MRPVGSSRIRVDPSNPHLDLHVVSHVNMRRTENELVHRHGMVARLKRRLERIQGGAPPTECRQRTGVDNRSAAMPEAHNFYNYRLRLLLTRQDRGPSTVDQAAHPLTARAGEQQKPWVERQSRRRAHCPWRCREHTSR